MKCIRVSLAVFCFVLAVIYCCGCGNSDEASVVSGAKIDLSDAYEVQRVTFNDKSKMTPFFAGYDETQICCAQNQSTATLGVYTWHLWDLNTKKDSDLEDYAETYRITRWLPSSTKDGVWGVTEKYGQIVIWKESEDHILTKEEVSHFSLLNGQVWTPIFSRDGKKIACVATLSDDADSGGNRKIIVLSDNKEEVIPFDDSGMTYIDHPSFSPDATEIVFEATRDGNKDLFLTSLDGKLQRLTNNTAPDSYPCFAVESRKIVFVSRRGGGDDLYIMDLSKPTR